MTTGKITTRGHASRGALLIGIAQAFRVGLGFLSGVILARLLRPTDFGLVAMVSSCVALVVLIQELGLNQATIQRKQISQAQRSALFWVSSAFGLVLSMLLIASAPAIAWFFGDSRLITLTAAFSIPVFLTGLQSQHLALLSRELRFKALAGLDLLSAITSAVVGVTVAWYVASYWALFAASLASAIVSFAFVWRLSNFRPGRPSFEGDFTEIALFGSGVSGFNIVNYFSRNADNLLIGRFYGSEQLGFYDRAYRLLLFPLSQIQAPLSRIMLPLLSRLQTEPERYRKAYIECVTLLMMASQPGIIFVVVFAEDVFLHLLGPHWLPSAHIFRWLGVCGILQVMTSTFGWLFISQGRGGDFFKIGLFGATTSVAAIVIGLYWGPIGVAAAYTIGEYLKLPVIWWSAGRRGPVTSRDLWTLVTPHAVAAISNSAALVIVSYFISAPAPLECLTLLFLSYIMYFLAIAYSRPKRTIVLQNVHTFARFISSKQAKLG